MPSVERRTNVLSGEATVRYERRGRVLVVCIEREAKRNAIDRTTADARAALARRGDSLPRDVAYLAPPSFMVRERRGQRYALASLALLDGPGAPAGSGAP